MMKLTQVDFLDYGTVVVSAADGRFDATGLPNGGYDLCVEPPVGFLNTCAWTGGATASVSENGTALKLVVQESATISFHVGNYVPDSVEFTTLSLSPPLKVGVFDRSGGYHAGKITSIDQTGTTYSVDVIPNSNYAVNVSSRSVRVVDSTGNDVDSRKRSTPMSITSALAGRVTRIPLQLSR